MSISPDSSRLPNFSPIVGAVKAEVALRKESYELSEAEKMKSTSTKVNEFATSVFTAVTAPWKKLGSIVKGIAESDSRLGVKIVKIGVITPLYAIATVALGIIGLVGLALTTGVKLAAKGLLAAGHKIQWLHAEKSIQGATPQETSRLRREVVETYKELCASLGKGKPLEEVYNELTANKPEIKAHLNKFLRSNNLFLRHAIEKSPDDAKFLIEKRLFHSVNHLIAAENWSLVRKFQNSLIDEIMKSPNLTEGLRTELLVALVKDVRDSSAAVVALNAIVVSGKPDLAKSLIKEQWAYLTPDHAEYKEIRSNLAILSARVGDLDLLKEIVTSGPEKLELSETVCGKGRGLLHYACMGGDTKTIKYVADLFEAKGSDNPYLQEDKNGVFPLLMLSSESANRLDEEYGMDGSAKGSFSGAVAYWDNLRRPISLTSTMAAGIIGKCLGDAIVAALLQYLPPVQSAIGATIEINAPVYGLMVAGAMIPEGIASEYKPSGLKTAFRKLVNFAIKARDPARGFATELTQYKFDVKNNDAIKNFCATRGMKKPANLQEFFTSVRNYIRANPEYEASIKETVESFGLTCPEVVRLPITSQAEATQAAETAIRAGDIVALKDALSFYAGQERVTPTAAICDALREAPYLSTETRSDIVSTLALNCAVLPNEEKLKQLDQLFETQTKVGISGRKSVEAAINQLLSTKPNLAILQRCLIAALRLSDTKIIERIEESAKGVASPRELWLDSHVISGDDLGDTALHVACTGGADMIIYAAGKISSSIAEATKDGQKVEYNVPAGGGLGTKLYMTLRKKLIGSSVDANVFNLENGRGQKIQDIIHPTLAFQLDEKLGLNRASPGSFTAIAESRGEAAADKLALQLALIAPTKGIFNLVLSHSISAAIAAASTAGAKLGPVGALLAGTAATLAIGTLVMVVDTAAAFVAGAGVEKAQQTVVGVLSQGFASFEAQSRGYDNTISQVKSDSKEFQVFIEDAKKRVEIDAQITNDPVFRTEFLGRLSEIFVPAMKALGVSEEVVKRSCASVISELKTIKVVSMEDISRHFAKALVPLVDISPVLASKVTQEAKGEILADGFSDGIELAFS